MKIVLLNKETFPKASVYAVAQGRRIKLADCLLQIEKYEKQVPTPILGKQNVIKRTEFKKAVCLNTDYTREVDYDFLSQVSRFEIMYEYQREDGIFETIVLDNVTLLEINSDNDMIFEIA